jgi:protease-4
MKALATFFGFVWRVLDGLRKVMHLIVLLVLFLGIGAALSPAIPIVAHKTALVIAPQGTLVERGCEERQARRSAGARSRSDGRRRRG